MDPTLVGVITTLNYTTKYTLRPKLWEYTVSTLNYNLFYTLHIAVNFAIILNEKNQGLGCKV